jgi:hypothetical protein
MLLTRARQWEQQWLRQGREEGRRDGEAGLLLGLLKRRFGVLPDWAMDRVGAADSDALRAWSLRVLDAASLAEILGEPPGQP